VLKNISVLRQAGLFCALIFRLKSWLKQQLQYDLWQAEQHRSEFHVKQLVAVM